jgi:branched-subunit amino acid aminotransferase/4-amino-4-deoxychorismate lyase
MGKSKMIYWYENEIFHDQPFLAPSISIQRADGVFESILTNDLQAYFLDRHIKRMQEAANKLGIPEKASDEVKFAVKEILAAQKFTGFGRMRINYFSDGQFFISLEPTNFDDSRSKLITYPFIRYSKSLMSGIKSTSYAESAAAVRYAQQKNFTDSLIINEIDQVVETGFSSFIYRVKNDWFTPSLKSGCLPGIIREVLLEQGIIAEQDLLKSKLPAIEAAAVLSSIRLVQLVQTIDQQVFNESQADVQFLSKTRELLLHSF